MNNYFKIVNSVYFSDPNIQSIAPTKRTVLMYKNNEDVAATCAP